MCSVVSRAVTLLATVACLALAPVARADTPLEKKPAKKDAT